jgi:ureidoglycolate hydrolase
MFIILLVNFALFGVSISEDQRRNALGNQGTQRRHEGVDRTRGVRCSG